MLVCIAVLVVTAIAAFFALRLVRGRQAHRTPRTAIGGTRNKLAFAAFERGVSSRQPPMNETRVTAAITHFQDAVHADPNYAQGWAALADSYVALNSMDIRSPESLASAAIPAANRAVFLDPNLAAAHLARATSEASFHWNWPLATSELQKTLALDPNLSAAYQWQAFAFTAQGNLPAARRQLAQALALSASTTDPVALDIRATLAHYFVYAGEPADSVQQLRQLCLNQPDTCNHLWLAEALEADHRPTEAATEFHISSSATPNYYALAREGRALALAGKFPAAQAILARLQTTPTAGPNTYVDPYGLSLLFAALNDATQAEHQLKAALIQHSPAATFYRVDPALQPAAQGEKR